LSQWGATPTCYRYLHFRYRCHTAQRVKNAWQTLAFLSTELNPAHQKYNAYNRELLAICEAMKHFCHMLEAHHFIIFTDHKANLRLPAEGGQILTTEFNHHNFLAQF
jgi:hypothetical protein